LERAIDFRIWPLAEVEAFAGECLLLGYSGPRIAHHGAPYREREAIGAPRRRAHPKAPERRRILFTHAENRICFQSAHLQSFTLQAIEITTGWQFGWSAATSGT